MNKYDKNIFSIIGITVISFLVFRYVLMIEFGISYSILAAVGLYGIYLNLKEKRKNNHRNEEA